MDRSEHTLSCLFLQLGLGNSTNEIEDFIKNNKILVDNIKLSQAAFWTSAQASFLDEALAQDSDWTEIVDTLDVLLRK